jgi:hypothetical protein
MEENKAGADFSTKQKYRTAPRQSGILCILAQIEGKAQADRKRESVESDVLFRYSEPDASFFTAELGRQIGNGPCNRSKR